MHPPRSDESAPDPAPVAPDDVDTRWLVGIAVVAAALILPNLGSPLLWQDEAQTATIARTILEHGIPLGTDGTNRFSQELGKETGDGAVWRWHTWLSFYLTAGAFALLGPTTAAARLPFALLGIATAVGCALLASALFRDRLAARAAGLVCATSLPFILFSRQCRYYTLAAALVVLGLWGYARLDTPGRRGLVALFLACMGLFHAHYVYCAALLLGLGIHALVFDRSRLAATLGVGTATAVLNAPWIVWFRDVRPGGDTYLASVLDAGKWLDHASDYGWLLGQFVPWGWLALPLVWAVWAGWQRETLPPGSPNDRRGAALLLCTIAAGIAVLALLSPLMFYRYLAPLAPPVFVLCGVVWAAAYRRLPIAAWAFAAVALATSQLGPHLASFPRSFVGPVEGLVAFLEANARPDDVVAISYGDLPLKFYTDLRVVGGLTGEPLDDLARARWLVIRRHTNTHEDARVKERLLQEIRGDPERFALHVLPAPDTQFQNREDPRLHRFESAPDAVPRLRVFERLP